MRNALLSGDLRRLLFPKNDRTQRRPKWPPCNLSLEHLSFHKTPVRVERPIHEHPAPHDVCLWHGAPVTAVKTVVAVVAKREIFFRWNLERAVRAAQYHR